MYITFCEVNTSYTAQTASTVIPCSLHNIAIITRRLYTGISFHSEMNEM